MVRRKLALIVRKVHSIKSLCRGRGCITGIEEGAELPGGGKRIKRCDKAFEDERNDGGGERKGRGRQCVKKRGTVCTIVVKVINLPCEVEWYLNLVFVGKMSIHCHLCFCV